MMTTAIAIDTRGYERSHGGRKPAPGGRGVWAFRVSYPDAPARTVFESGAYRDCLRKVKAAARADRAYTIEVCG